jgi:hypothetical protein
MRVFENQVLRRIFESKRDEVIGGCRELHSEEPYDLYFSRTAHLNRVNYLIVS